MLLEPRTTATATEIRTRGLTARGEPRRLDGCHRWTRQMRGNGDARAIRSQLPRSNPVSRPARKSRHSGCIICGQFHQWYDAQKNAQLAANARKIRAVYSACLSAQEPFSRKALAQKKQEAPVPVRTEASTAQTVCDTEMRGAGAQSDRGR